MYRTFSTAALEAELIEIAREMCAADPGELPGLAARFARVEAEIRRREGTDVKL
jgi:hypothetical protein